MPGLSRLPFWACFSSADLACALARPLADTQSSALALAVFALSLSTDPQSAPGATGRRRRPLASVAPASVCGWDHLLPVDTVSTIMVAGGPLLGMGGLWVGVLDPQVLLRVALHLDSHPAALRTVLELWLSTHAVKGRRLPATRLPRGFLAGDVLPGQSPCPPLVQALKDSGLCEWVGEEQHLRRPGARPQRLHPLQAQPSRVSEVAAAGQSTPLCREGPRCCASRGRPCFEFHAWWHFPFCFRQSLTKINRELDTIKFPRLNGVPPHNGTILRNESVPPRT